MKNAMHAQNRALLGAWGAVVYCPHTVAELWARDASKDASLGLGRGVYYFSCVVFG